MAEHHDPMTVFELDAVSKFYDGIPAVRPIDLTIPAGITIVLIGPSGCGKSSLLRLMVGLVQPDSGEVRFEGTRITPHNILHLRRKMGYVIQEGGLFPHLTGRENVALMAEHLRWKKERIDERIDELTQLTQFPTEGLHRYPVQLSGGQRQRLSLMRALMLDPDVLLMDEPLGSLDAMIRANLQNELRDIFQKLSKTVVMVTHDIGEAGFFGDLIVLLRDGAIVQQSPLHDLVHAAADPFVTQFINAQRRPFESLESVDK